MHSLEVPKQQAPPVAPAREAVQQVAATSSCSFLGGLVSAELSPQCCTNIQVVTQRQLQQFGMAQKCKTDWRCEPDGKLPSKTFELQALSSLCGEPGCLPSVVVAVKHNPATMNRAENVANICSTLASMGGSKASPAAVSKLLMGGGRGRAGKGKKGANNNEEEDDSMCFPGEAIVSVQGKGDVPLTNVRTGDMVLVASQGQLKYEPILSFLHARKNADAALSFVTIMHTKGMIRASASHIMFASTESGWTSKLAGEVQVGDRVFVAGVLGDTWDGNPSRVLRIQRSSTMSGMYAPLTSSGTIVVDGVVASTYASPSAQKPLPHQLAHTFLLPVRIYHYFGLASWLQPMWQKICSPSHASKSWQCQGGDVSDGETSGKLEEMHPYIRVAWKAFRLDLLL